LVDWISHLYGINIFIYTFVFIYCKHFILAIFGRDRIRKTISRLSSLQKKDFFSMRTIMKITLLVILASLTMSAQQTTFQDSLLDHMTGKWVLKGTIDGKETTHDIIAEWVLGHQYMQLHETSREKNAQGGAEYEAIVYIGWDQPSKRYACLWLDVTGGGGLSAQAIGHAKRNGDKMAFLFKGSDGSIFHTTFVYTRATDTWQWLMDNEVRGKLQSFARVKLTRK
jgi:hypothetical protein